MSTQSVNYRTKKSDPPNYISLKTDFYFVVQSGPNKCFFDAKKMSIKALSYFNNKNDNSY